MALHPAARAIQERTKSKPRAVKKFTATLIETLAAGREQRPAQEGLYLLVRDIIGGAPSRTWMHRIKYQNSDTYLSGAFP